VRAGNEPTAADRGFLEALQDCADGKLSAPASAEPAPAPAQIAAPAPTPAPSAAAPTPAAASGGDEITDDEFERHRGTFTLAWQGRSGNITLTASSEDRQYLIRNELDGQADAVALSVKWPVGGGLDLVSQLREQRNVFSEDSGEERFSLASLGLRMNFSQRSYAALTVQQAEQDSERDARSYEEGRVIAEVFLQF